jgi:hypothetical protein
MTALQKVSLGTPPTGSDGDTTRIANTKANANVDVLTKQATLTSIAALTAVRALTAADVGQRITFSFTGAQTVTLPLASTCAADQVLLLRNAGASVVTLAKATGSSDTVGLSKLNPGETTVLDSDGASKWSVLERGRSNSDNEVVNGTLAVGGAATLTGGLTAGGATITQADNTASTVAVSITSKNGATSLNLSYGQIWTPAGWTLNLTGGAGLILNGGTGNVSVTSPATFSARPTFAGNTPWDSGNFNPAAISASTTMTFTVNGSERQRIDASGFVHINETSGWIGAPLSVRATSATTAWAISSYGAYQSGGGCYLGRVESPSTAYAAWYFGANQVGSITCNNGAATSYNTTSDYRLKANYAPIPDASAALSRIKFYQGEFKAAPGVLAHYVLAHELQEVVPSAVSGEKDAVGDWYPVYRSGYEPSNVQPDDIVGAEQEIIPQAVDYSKLVPLLGAALQDALARIAALEAKAAA